MTVSPIKTPLMTYTDYLKKQGISEFEAQAMGLQALSAAQCSELLGYKVWNEGVFLPYQTDESGYFRIRMLGGKTKYLSKRGSGQAPPYMSSNVVWKDVCADVTRDIGIVEGEFKSWTACRAGMAWVGLGGVDMQEGLLGADIEWKGRRVFICFDKDAGWETGTYKPGVSRALGRLAARLIAKGAQVWILNIPGELDSKLGLDDYLNAGGTLEELVGKAVPPPEHCEMLAWMLENCIFVTGTDNTHVYNLTDGSRKSVDDFHKAHIEKRRMVVGADNRPRWEQITKVWMVHSLRQTARNYTLMPSRGVGLVGDLINLWVGYPEFEGVAGVEIADSWQKFMEGLFGEHWRWVGSWVGHMLNRPEEKSMQAVLIATAVRSIGKSVFGEIVGKLVGESHYTECKPEEMMDKFNIGMSGRTFVAVHELELSNKISEGQINNLITSEKYKLEGKGKDGIYLPDLRRWYMTTNSSVSMRLSAGQRRLLVIHPPRTHADTRGEWGQWVDSVVARYKENAGALRGIRDWFDACLMGWEEEFGRWSSTRPVPLTEESEELAAASLTVNQIMREAAITWMEENGGVGVLAHEHRQLLAKVSAAIGLEVKARGGQLLRYKLPTLGGGQQEVVIWDLTGRLPRKVAANRSYRLDPAVADVDSLGLGVKAAALWQLLSSLRDRLSGGSDKY